MSFAQFRGLSHLTSPWLSSSQGTEEEGGSPSVYRSFKGGIVLIILCLTKGSERIKSKAGPRL